MSFPLFLKAVYNKSAKGIHHLYKQWQVAWESAHGFSPVKNHTNPFKPFQKWLIRNVGLVHDVDIGKYCTASYRE